LAKLVFTEHSKGAIPHASQDNRKDPC
jgi:hypothetical protein